MIKNIRTDLLVPFENHPFKKRYGIKQQELVEQGTKRIADIDRLIEKVFE